MTPAQYRKGLAFPRFTHPPKFVFEAVSFIYLLLIGPVTYLILKRQQRLNLMYILVPLISSLFCLSILFYAVLAEGFSTRVNRLSFTKIDQTTGSQQTKATFHMYSGLQPKPYQFQSGSFGTLLGIQERDTYSVWEGDTQTLYGGNILARTNHQVAGFNSGETTQGLVVKFPKGQEAPEVTNLFDFKVKMSVIQLSLKNQEQGYWCVTDLEPGKSATATFKKRNSAVFDLQSVLNKETHSTSIGKNVDRRRGSRSSNVPSSTDRLFRADILFVALDNTHSHNTKRGSYLTILADSDFVKTPVSNPDFGANLNIVLGRLP